ncbi:MAG: energy transducer TonB [Crocinitomicaceae bacterium]|nr:energy transducer TonB [Crocinitomicaceae bacterium]
MRIILVIILILTAQLGYTQEPDTLKSEILDNSEADRLAEFPGGEMALQKYIINRVEYPKEARDNMIQGTVYVEFIVEKKGEVSHLRIVRGVHPILDESALKAFRNLPRFKPALQKGELIRVRFTFPVKFKLT